MSGRILLPGGLRPMAELDDGGSYEGNDAISLASTHSGSRSASIGMAAATLAAARSTMAGRYSVANAAALLHSARNAQLAAPAASLFPTALAPPLSATNPTAAILDAALLRQRLAYDDSIRAARAVQAVTMGQQQQQDRMRGVSASMTMKSLDASSRLKVQALQADARLRQRRKLPKLPPLRVESDNKRKIGPARTKTSSCSFFPLPKLDGKGDAPRIVSLSSYRAKWNTHQKRASSRIASRNGSRADASAALQASRAEYVRYRFNKDLYNNAFHFEASERKKNNDGNNTEPHQNRHYSLAYYSSGSCSSSSSSSASSSPDHSPRPPPTETTTTNGGHNGCLLPKKRRRC